MTMHYSDAFSKQLKSHMDLSGDYQLTHFVFVNDEGKTFIATVTTQHSQGLFGKAVIDGVSRHTLRRQFITKLASKRIDIKLLTTMVGERSVQVTAKYFHTNPDKMRIGAKLIKI